MNWEDLHTLRRATLRRHGRYLVADLREPHEVLSTSVRNGGLVDHVRHLVNHQSCEGAGHDARFKVITEHGQEAYHDVVCAEIDLPADATAMMGTAANMNYAAIASARDGDVEVVAVVTAGVQSNATCAGDPAAWRETAAGMERVTEAPVVAGTINTLLLIDAPLTAAAFARTVVTMTEGKSAALQRLAVPSCYSADLATGTGTDQYCIAAPRATIDGGVRITSASPHMKFGEIVGRAVRDATVEALRWQNGLEASYTRGVFHALARYGVKQQTIFDDLTGLLEPADIELLRKNTNAAFYEPLVGAAAHALATVLDRVRHGTLPPSAAPDAVVQQAATFAVSLAAMPDRWAEFRVRLQATVAAARADGLAPMTPATATDPRLAGLDAKRLVLSAIALGWSEKWRPR